MIRISNEIGHKHSNVVLNIAGLKMAATEDLSILILEEACNKLHKALRLTGTFGYLVGWFDGEQFVITGCLQVSHIDSSKKPRQMVESWMPGGICVIGCYNMLPSVEHLQASLKNGELELRNQNSLIPHEVISLDVCQRLLQSQSLTIHITARMNLYVAKTDGIYGVDIDKLIQHTSFYLLDFERVIFRDNISEPDYEMFVQNDTKRVDPNIFRVNLITTLAPGEKRYVPDKHKRKSMIITRIDVVALCYLHHFLTAMGLWNLYASCVRRQLRNYNSCLRFQKKGRHCGPKMCYFELPGWCHPVEIIFPANIIDRDLETFRRNVLHPAFLEPPIRPLFRTTNSVDLFGELDPILLNPHVGLQKPDDGQVHMVRGRYSYYHCRQTDIGDRSWGSGYAAFKTLVSWYKFQGYSEKDNPPLGDIQRIVHFGGFKTKGFAGSKTGISVQDICTSVLVYLGYNSEVLHVAHGDEISSKGNKIVNHFKHNGPPVVVGNGENHYVIIGVCVNESNIVLKYLILDPGFEGKDNVETIQRNGGCGWKAGFFDRNQEFRLLFPGVSEMC